MSYKVRFAIPGLPKLTNTRLRQHWRVRVKEKNYWKALVAAQMCGRIPDKPLKYALVICKRYSSVCPDYDGLSGSFKDCIDSLVDIGVLEDDKMTNIGFPIFQWIKCPAKKGSIEIEVIETLSVNS